MNTPLSAQIAAKSSAPNFNKMALLDFDPSRDGFGFANVFVWTDQDLNTLTAELGPIMKGLGVGLPTLLGQRIGGRRGAALGLAVGAMLSRTAFSHGLVSMVARRWPTFGLCGGMALLAKDRWERKLGEPTSELQRDSLRPILRLHQAQTIRASWPTFLKYWIQAHAHGGVSFSDELFQIANCVRDEINAGRLAVLGLVGDTPDPFAMHQVVAFGYEHGSDGVDFHVYDPNAPARTRHIIICENEGRTFIETDLPTGPKKSGGYHISKTAGTLSMVFVVDA